LVIKDIIDAIQAERIYITDHADEEAQADHLKMMGTQFIVFGP
jgi:hypothetical protein